MGSVTKSKTVLPAGDVALDKMFRAKYTTDFQGLSWTAGELIAYFVGTTNEAAASTLMDDTETPTCTASALAITTDFGDHIVADVTNVTADATDTKYIRIDLIVDDTTGDPEVAAYEKTTGNYAAIASGKTLGAKLKEFSVPVSGTVLTEIADFINEEG